MTLGLGCRPDPSDPRDHLFGYSVLGAPVAELPAQAGIPVRALISDQGATNACCGFALRYAIDACMARTSLSESVSAMYLYWNARNVHGEAQHDGGTYLRAVLQAANKQGLCAESVWPWDHERINRRPGWQAYREGLDRRTRLQYRRIRETGVARVRAIQRSIVDGSPVLIGAPVDEHFMRLREHEVSPRSLIPVGGHAMCILGYNEQGFEGPNSWGPAWGNLGWFTLSKEFVCAPEADLWSVSWFG